ncbi:MAG: metallophosphoesterase [Vicinamibacterales bacterium]
MTAYRIRFLLFATSIVIVAGSCSNSTPASPTGSTSSGTSTPSSVAPPTVVLGRPTDSGVAANLRASADLDAYLEVGDGPGTYNVQSTQVSIAANTTGLVTVQGLRPDASYVYRVRYRARSTSSFAADSEHTFHTQRSSGSTFTFVVQADPHLDDNSSTAVYTQTLQNMLADKPDFLIDLGDNSMGEKCAVVGTVLCSAPSPASEASVTARAALARRYFENITHSVPLFLVLGNHDGESGWTTPQSPTGLDAWSVTARKALFPNPEPDRFYSGSSVPATGVGLRQNYYAFEWGDALFVMLDPYTYTQTKPGTDGWAWTLGATQYQWFSSTLATSRARYKFVFSHHMLGGNGSEARGGAAFAGLYEWGGRNADASWGFDRQRPGWTAPIHQLMVNARVSAWFHGHDHLYARESVDGIVYQEVPQPSLARYDMPDPGAGYGYVGSNGVNIFPSSGHLRVTVSPANVRVEYVRAVAPGDENATRRNATIIQSYTIP